MKKYSILKYTKGSLYIFEGDKLMDVKNDVVNHFSHPFDSNVITRHSIQELLNAGKESVFIPNIGFLEIAHKIVRDIYSLNMIGFINSNGLFTFIYVVDRESVIEEK